MKLKTTVILGLIGSSILLFVQFFRSIIYIICRIISSDYFYDMFASATTYDLLQISYLPIFDILLIIGWSLITIFFIGLLKKTK
jgi:hypothetical protein